MTNTLDLPTLTVAAEPYEFELRPAQCALLIIDMQRDFLEPGGFGEMLGNDVSQLRRTIEPNRRLLAAWRGQGWAVIHTREGHRPDLADLPPCKKIRGRSAQTDRRYRPDGPHPRFAARPGTTSSRSSIRCPASR